MKTFYITDYSSNEYDTYEEAVLAAKKRAADPFFQYNYDSLNEGLYIYKAVAVAKAPLPNVDVEVLSPEDLTPQAPTVVENSQPAA